MKKLLSILVIFVFAFSIVVQAASDTFLSVADEASVLSESTERYIYTQNRALSKATQARIIVAAVPTSGELSTYEYAQNMYKELGIDGIGRNNSVFILLCMDEKDYCHIVSEGISASLTDETAQKFLVDFLEKDFDKGKYDDAVIKTFNAFAGWYENEYNTKLELTEDMTDYDTMIQREKKMQKLRKILITLAVVVFVAGFVFALVYFRRKKRMKNLLKKRQERRRRYAQSLHGK